MEIQAALDQLSSIGGGILELGAGQWNLSSSSIFITGVGVTLRGELPEQAGDSSKTVIRVSGESRIPFVIGSANPESIVYRNGTATEIVTQYVGAGQTTFEVEDASHLQSGDYVEIQRTVTEEWIKAEGMDNLVRDGKQQTWIEPGTIYSQRRQIAAINNQTIQLNYGLTDPLNQTTDGLSTILRYDLPFNFTRSCSLESMTIQLVDDQSGNPINDDDNFSQALIFQPWGSDNWARQLSISGFISAVHVARDATRVTLQDVNFWRSQPTDKSAGYPADILIEGSQVLLHRCSTAGVNNSDSFAVATGSLVAGPISVVNHATSDVRHMIEPHARWATGVLIDNSLIGTLNLINRGVYGSGQGWSVSCSSCVYFEPQLITFVWFEKGLRLFSRMERHIFWHNVRSEPAAIRKPLRRLSGPNRRKRSRSRQLHFTPGVGLTGLSLPGPTGRSLRHQCRKQHLAACRK